MIRTAALVGVAVSAAIAVAALGPWAHGTAHATGQSKLYQVFNSQLVSGTVTSAFVDTEGCDTFTVFFESSGQVNPFTLRIVPSPNGVAAWGTGGLTLFNAQIEPGTKYSQTVVAGAASVGFAGLAAPFLALQAESGTAVNVTVWLYCIGPGVSSASVGGVAGSPVAASGSGGLTTGFVIATALIVVGTLAFGWVSWRAIGQWRTP